MTITKALVTHFHPDHLGGRFAGMSITGAAELVARLPVKVYINKHEAGFVGRVSDLSASDLVPVDAGDAVDVGDVPRHVRPHAGTHAGLAVLPRRGQPDLGRHALHRQLRADRSPRQRPGRALSQPERHPAQPAGRHGRSTPGHNYADRPTSTIGHEKRRNMFMRFASLDDFLGFVGR